VLILLHRRCAQLGALTLVLAAAWGALHPDQATANDDNPGFGHGASYLTTVTDSNGNFCTRSVMTLHADDTMSVEDADAGGPTYFFTGEFGLWRPDGKGGAVGRTIDFDFFVGHPVYPNGNVARIDYMMSFQNDGIVGTHTVTIFSLQENPFGGGGTNVGTFNFTGLLITP
jgi:hypothetical protein